MKANINQSKPLEINDREDRRERLSQPFRFRQCGEREHEIDLVISMFLNVKADPKISHFRWSVHGHIPSNRERQTSLASDSGDGAMHQP